MIEYIFHNNNTPPLNNVKNKVSIIVPVYNVEKYIYRCINSILTQTYSNLECILVDDFSPDNCPKICDEYEKKDARIKVIHKDKNEDLPQARKTGFEYSSGNFIQFIDSDDWIEADMTEKLVNAAIKTDADIVTCDFYINNVNDYYYKKCILDFNNNFNNIGLGHDCSVWNKIYRRELIALIKFPIGNKYEDLVITQQAYFYSNKIIHIPYALYHYFNNIESMTHVQNEKTVYETRDNFLFAINFIQENLKDKYKLKEKDINEYINRFKFNYQKYIPFAKKKQFFEFYYESKFYRWMFIKIFKKLMKSMLFIVPYGFVLFKEKILHKRKI
jgi:glycosyltransferase involved in cell wall biosynthesis